MLSDHLKAGLAGGRGGDHMADLPRALRVWGVFRVRVGACVTVVAGSSLPIPLGLKPLDFGLLPASRQRPEIKAAA